MPNGQGRTVVHWRSIHHGSGGTAETLETVVSATARFIAVFASISIAGFIMASRRTLGARSIVEGGGIGALAMRGLLRMPVEFAGGEGAT